jgi:hypothetical protein
VKRLHTGISIRSGDRLSSRGEAGWDFQSLNCGAGDGSASATNLVPGTYTCEVFVDP